MTATILLPGTLCDARVFGTVSPHLAAPVHLDFGAFSDARAAARALIGDVPAGSLGMAFSLGSWVLLEMLRLDPERFRAIVLLGGNAHPDAAENAAMRRARVERAREQGFDALFADEWPAMLGEAHRDDKALRGLILDMANAAGHARHACQAELNISRPDCRDLAARPPRPIHVLAGAQDGLCPRARYEAAASGPGSSLTILEESGHYVPLEAPDAVLALLGRTCPEALR